MWNGTAEKYFIKIYLNEKKQETNNLETKETVYYNLRIDVIDKNIFKTD